MQATRLHFSQDYLIDAVRKSFAKKLSKRPKDKKARARTISDLDCLMAGLAMFTFKYPSMLQFDGEARTEEPLCQNLRQLYQIGEVPCDTYMRERLDDVDPGLLRLAFTRLFALLQRGRVLDHFRFLDSYYLVSLDGTGYFSSSTVHCEQCCVKEDKQGHKTYWHGMVSAALVHPSQKVVFPLSPEPIMLREGSSKNDCERNAAHRWVEGFRREHPHLPIVLVADGLYANAPFLTLLSEKNISFIIVCREDDHPYLMDWIKAADHHDAPSWQETTEKVKKEYQYMLAAPLNGSSDLTVNVIRYRETDLKTNRVKAWMWVTDLPVNNTNIHDLVQGGRARWKIENETFNTLKTQGYNFEHNYGHGYQHLTTVLVYLMLLAFFIDQCLQKVNKRFQSAYERCGRKRTLWERMRVALDFFHFPSFESLYEVIAHPPPPMTLAPL